MNLQHINSQTEELTDTVQVVLECFPNLRADHRPQGADWYRWLIYKDGTSEVIGVVVLGEAFETMSLMNIKRLLRMHVIALVAA